MSFDDGVRNFLRTNPQIKKILSVAVVVFGIYIFFSDFIFFFNKPQNEGFPIERIVLMIIFIIAGMIYFSRSLKYDVDYNSYDSLKDKIAFESTHPGCDALCCFLTRADHGVKLKRNSQHLLIFGAITQAPGDLSIPELLEDIDIQIFSKRQSCCNLNFIYKIENDKLVLKLECKDYINRPIPCKIYPQKELIKCLHEQYCAGTLEQLVYFKWCTLFFFAVSQKKYPALKKFSMGQAYNYHKKYWLIPIPLECLPQKCVGEKG